MKQAMKKLMAVLLVMALAIGAAQTVQGAMAQAASKKVTKADFKFTGTAKKTMNTVMYNSKKSRCAYGYWDIREEKAPKKCVKTKRGITLLSTKKQVFSKYGKETLRKFSQQPLYDYLKKNYKDGWNFIKGEKYVTYSYNSNKDASTYTLWFFFDKKGKVNAICATKNAGEF